jgi:uncharacterized membrane protein YqhA
MANLSNYSYPSYESNTTANIVLASFIGISSVAWFIQAIQTHFQPRRINILLLISHLTIFVALVLRTVPFTNIRSSRAALTAETVLLVIGQRTIILANYGFLVEVGGPKTCAFRAIIISMSLAAIGSAILLAPARKLSRNANTIERSIRLMQISAVIVVCMTVLFYPIWYATKTLKDMTKQAIILLIISSFTCLIAAVCILVALLPVYNIGANQQESRSYIFYFTPLTIALLTWTIFHPKRSLVLTHQQQENIKRNIGTSL